MQTSTPNRWGEATAANLVFVASLAKNHNLSAWKSVLERPGRICQVGVENPCARRHVGHCQLCPKKMLLGLWHSCSEQECQQRLKNTQRAVDNGPCVEKATSKQGSRLDYKFLLATALLLQVWFFYSSSKLCQTLLNNGRLSAVNICSGTTRVMV